MNTKDLIIEAAKKLYAEQGYDGMTMKQIAKEVGIKAPSLYAFFESKADIFLHIYQDTIARHLHLAETITNEDRHQTIKEQLEELLHSIVSYQYQEVMQIKIYIRMLLFPPDGFDVDLKEKVIELEKKEIAMFARMFKKGMESGEIREGDCDAIAISFACLLDGLFWRMQRYDESTFHQHLQILWEQFWRGIQS